jgi:hypothetical protein
MKEHPILFSTKMIQAILEGKKNQTRRVIKSPRNKEVYGFRINMNMDGSCKYPVAINEEERSLEGTINMKCPYGKIDDILWVRETWQHTKCLNLSPDDENYGYIYRASENGREFENNMEEWIWKPSIFMPKEACRIKLKIKNIRVERLQDISEDDSINEGIQKHEDAYRTNFRQPEAKSYLDGYTWTAQESYKTLWDKINGIGSWNKNPWVWVINFEKI